MKKRAGRPGDGDGARDRPLRRARLGLDPVRVAYLDELVVTAHRETGATFFIITHNIQSVMRTADYMGVLFRSHLVKFASKAEMLATDNPIIQQFLAGGPKDRSAWTRWPTPAVTPAASSRATPPC